MRTTQVDDYPVAVLPQTTLRMSRKFESGAMGESQGEGGQDRSDAMSRRAVALTVRVQVNQSPDHAESRTPT